MAGAEAATVIVMTGTGSRYEDERENGLAHFLEHMFFKGTKKRPSAKAISEELDGVGAVYNAFTAKERTAYYAKVSKQYLDTALDVISDIFLNSTLPEEEITKERGAVIQEIDMYEDMPMRTVDNVFDALIFTHSTGSAVSQQADSGRGTEHPLGRTILGPKENIRTFTRKDFAAYLKRNYTPLNTVICVAGAFDEAKVFAKIEKEFGGLKHGNPPDYISFTPEQREPRILIKEKKTDQTHFIIGVPAYPYLHKDEYALSVLTTILGAGMSSRLFLEVREKRGLAYSIHSWIDRYPDTGYFAVQAGVEHAKLEETIETVLTEFKKIATEKISAAELAKAKAYIKGTRTLALETSDAIAEDAATSLINLGRVRPPDEILKGIDAVSSDDILRVASDIFKTERLNLAIIGPHISSERLKRVVRI